MVKRLVKLQKVEQAIKAREPALAKPAAPVAHMGAPTARLGTTEELLKK
jgi:hypothetical protein